MPADFAVNRLFSRGRFRLLLGILLLGGCSVTGQAPDSGQSLPATDAYQGRIAMPQRDRAYLEQVPFFPQETYPSGPAALATMLQHQGKQVTPKQLLDQIDLSAKQAVLPPEMIAVGRGYGLLAYPLKPELAHLLRQIDAGYPVLVFHNLGSDTLPKWRFSVLVGYDLKRKTLTLRSGTEPAYQTDFRTFISNWRRADHWASLLLSPGDIPAVAEPEPYLEASLDLADLGLNVSAQKALEAGVRRWPEAERIRLALSNTYFQSGLFDAASDTLLQSPSLSHSGGLWNNIAYIQLARQCYSSAFAAVQCAVTLSPDDANIQQSFRDILGKSQRADGTMACPQLNCPQPVRAF